MSLSFLFPWVYSQLFVSLPVPSKDHTGETIIVTGANTGLGLEAAKHFVRLNAATVILACRNTEKGEAAAKSIEESTGRKGVAQVWPLDLSSYDSVKAFARKAEELKRLDAVVESAGKATETFSRAEGQESTITTNVISTFLLALLLLPKLKQTAQKQNVTPRLSIVTSEVHNFTEIPERKAERLFEGLANEEMSAPYMGERYPVSKLLEVLYIRELAPRTKGDVVINMLTPGLCHSELSRESGWFLEVMKFFLARSTEQGSRTLCNAVEQGEETHGQYLADCKIGKLAPFVKSEEGQKTQKRVWEELNGILEAIEPGVTSNM